VTRISIAIAALALIPSAHATTVEADNGTVYRIGPVHIPYDHNYPRTVEVYSDDGMIFMMLDCNGNFGIRTLSGSEGGWRHIPSRSVTAKIAQIACGAKTHS
jgi:hypothetical protein